VLNAVVERRELGSPEEAVAETKQMTILRQLTPDARVLSTRLFEVANARRASAEGRGLRYVFPLLGVENPLCPT